MPEHVGAPALLRLLAWLSPAFPVGAFSYSHGLESAVVDGLIPGAAALERWIGDLIEHGSGWNDAVLLAEAWRQTASGGDVAPVAELAAALASSAERHLETMAQGDAFATAVSAWTGDEPAGQRPAYCIALGIAAARQNIPVGGTLAAFLLAFAQNLAQAAIRLSVLGQRDCIGLLARLEPRILEIAERAARSSLDDLGACTLLSDVAAMRHEILHSRLFRS